MTPLYAYFMTWATYGTWLPGDNRGWVKYRHGLQNPSPALRHYVKKQMQAKPCLLSFPERKFVEKSIEQHIKYRNWTLFAQNCRSTHMHILLYAQAEPSEIRRQLKAWSSRSLNKLDSSRRKWWAERGSCMRLKTENDLLAVSSYINDAQD